MLSGLAVVAVVAFAFVGGVYDYSVLIAVGTLLTDLALMITAALTIQNVLYHSTNLLPPSRLSEPGTSPAPPSQSPTASSHAGLHRPRRAQPATRTLLSASGEPSPQPSPAQTTPAACTSASGHPALWSRRPQPAPRPTTPSARPAPQRRHSSPCPRSAPRLPRTARSAHQPQRRSRPAPPTPPPPSPVPRPQLPSAASTAPRAAAERERQRLAVLIRPDQRPHTLIRAQQNPDRRRPVRILAAAVAGMRTLRRSIRTFVSLREPLRDKATPLRGGPSERQRRAHPCRPGRPCHDGGDAYQGSATFTADSRLRSRPHSGHAFRTKPRPKQREQFTRRSGTGNGSTAISWPPPGH